METYGIKSVPTLLFLKDKEQAGEMSGRIQQEELEEALENVIAST